MRLAWVALVAVVLGLGSGRARPRHRRLRLRRRSVMSRPSRRSEDPFSSRSWISAPSASNAGLMRFVADTDASRNALRPSLPAGRLPLSVQRQVGRRRASSVSAGTPTRTRATRCMTVISGNARRVSPRLASARPRLEARRRASASTAGTTSSTAGASATAKTELLLPRRRSRRVRRRSRPRSGFRRARHLDRDHAVALHLLRQQDRLPDGVRRQRSATWWLRFGANYHFSPVRGDPLGAARSSARSAHVRQSRFLTNTGGPMHERVVGEGLTFDDVLLIPSKTEVLPGEVDTSVQLTPEPQARNPALLGRDGHGDRDAARDRARAGGRTRRDPQEPLDRGAGRRGREGQAVGERDDHRSGHAAARSCRSARRSP